MASVTLATSGATNPIALKRKYLETLIANATMGQSPRRKLYTRKRTTAQFINKHHTYDHPHEIPGFRVAFFESDHPSSFNDWLNLRPGNDSCPCEDNSHFLENWRIELEMKKHFRLDLPPFPRPGPGPYPFRHIKASGLEPISPEFDDDNYEVHVWESPTSKRILEWKARCEVALKALEGKEMEKQKLGLPLFPKPGPGPYIPRPIEAGGLAPIPPVFENKYQVFIRERFNSKRVLEKRARCEASLKASAEQHPGGWKLGPGCSDDSAEFCSSPEPMVFARNPCALLNSEDDISLGDEDDEEEDKLYEADSLEPMVFVRNLYDLLNSEDDMFSELEGGEEDELCEADDKDESFVVLNKRPSPFFETEEEFEDGESDFSLLRDDDGDDETVYPPSSFRALFEVFFEAIVQLVHNQDETPDLDGIESSFGEDDGFGDEEEDDEKEEPGDISSRAGLHIVLEF